MGKNQVSRPLNRSKLRLALGKRYYTLKRYLLWYSGRYRFARQRQIEPLPYLHFEHKTPLLRKLKDVDMQYQYNKIINLRLATAKLDGLILQPGETLSYWKTIGKPTAKKGYVPGMVLFMGTFRYGIGGGLCQLSNLIYWMTLHTPLTVVERYRHSFDVFPDSNRVLPFGSGATCVYPYRDLMIRNDTADTFQLQVRVGPEFLEGRWLATTEPAYRYQVVERNHMMRSEPWGGFSRHNELYRQRYSLDGEFIDETYITGNHALTMYVPFLQSRTVSNT
ncbi:MAG: VanW family protein [Firmicutes bacterium]|nr:VanW family protein [Bacillota bacterium]